MAEQSWRRRARKKCLQTPLTSYGAASGARCVCSHLVLQRAVTEREGSILLDTRLGDAEGAGSAHHLQE